MYVVCPVPILGCLVCRLGEQCCGCPSPSHAQSFWIDFEGKGAKRKAAAMAQEDSSSDESDAGLQHHPIIRAYERYVEQFTSKQ